MRCLLTALIILTIVSAPGWCETKREMMDRVITEAVIKCSNSEYYAETKDLCDRAKVSYNDILRRKAAEANTIAEWKSYQNIKELKRAQRQLMIEQSIYNLGQNILQNSQPIYTQPYQPQNCYTRYYGSQAYTNCY